MSKIMVNAQKLLKQTDMTKITVLTRDFSLKNASSWTETRETREAKWKPNQRFVVSDKQTPINQLLFNTHVTSHSLEPTLPNSKPSILSSEGGFSDESLRDFDRLDFFGVQQWISGAKNSSMIRMVTKIYAFYVSSVVFSCICVLLVPCSILFIVSVDGLCVCTVGFTTLTFFFMPRNIISELCFVWSLVFLWVYVTFHLICNYFVLLVLSRIKLWAYYFRCLGYNIDELHSYFKSRTVLLHEMIVGFWIIPFCLCMVMKW